MEWWLGIMAEAASVEGTLAAGAMVDTPGEEWVAGAEAIVAEVVVAPAVVAVAGAQLVGATTEPSHNG